MKCGRHDGPRCSLSLFFSTATPLCKEKDPDVSESRSQWDEEPGAGLGCLVRSSSAACMAGSRARGYEHLPSGWRTEQVSLSYTSSVSTALLKNLWVILCASQTDSGLPGGYTQEPRTDG